MTYHYYQLLESLSNHNAAATTDVNYATDSRFSTLVR